MQKKEVIVAVLATTLIIIWIIGFLLLIKGNATFLGNNQKYESTKNAINDELTNCLKKTTYNGIMLLGNQGMIYPTIYLEKNNSKVAYLYYEGASFIPENMNKINLDLSRYVNENIPECINEIKDKYEGINNLSFSDTNNIIATASMNDEKIYSNLKYVVKIGQDNNITISSFESSLDFRFFKAYDRARQIVKNIQNDPKWIDLDILSSDDLIIKLEKINNNVLVYTITTPLGLDAKPFTYRFAVKY